MGRTGDTKKQIVDLLEKKNQTLTDITNKLELAPSTVSQHLKELQEEGKIRQVDDKPRKWKYYEAVSRAPRPFSDPRFEVRRIVMPIAGFILIAVLATGLYLWGVGGVATAQQVYIAPGSAVPNGSTIFTLSDSPQFYNISAIFITVTNASVRTSAGKWYKIPLQERTFNLVQLNNISELLSGVNLSQGSYDAIALSASNASAIVNGSSRPIVLPSGKLLVIGKFNITSNATNWINIDFDLAQSVHVTQNGTIVLLPVLFISRDTGNDIELNSSSIVIPKFPLQRHERFQFGMGMNGSMMENFTAQQNMTIGISDGRPIGLGIGPRMLFLKMRRGIVIGDNAMAFIEGNLDNGTQGNASGGVVAGPAALRGAFARDQQWKGPISPQPWNTSTGVIGNGSTTWVHLPHGFFDGNSSDFAGCIQINGAVYCDDNDSATNATAVLRPPLGRTVIVNGSCAGLPPGAC
jgi:DNA-binding transcriptional ArsR family regulator